MLNVKSRVKWKQALPGNNLPRNNPMMLFVRINGVREISHFSSLKLTLQETFNVLKNPSHGW